MKKKKKKKKTCEYLDNSTKGIIIHCDTIMVYYWKKNGLPNPKTFVRKLKNWDKHNIFVLKYIVLWWSILNHFQITLLSAKVVFPHFIHGEKMRFSKRWCFSLSHTARKFWRWNLNLCLPNFPALALSYLSERKMKGKAPVILLAKRKYFWYSLFLVICLQ